MNHRLALFALFALVPCVALSTNPSPPPTSTSSSNQDQRQDQDQHQGQEQGQEQGQQQQQGDYTVTSSYKERRQAPAVSAPSIYASGSCAYGWSAGVSTPLGSATGGKSRPDDDCNRRELVRVVMPLNPWLALKVACSDPIIVAMIAAGDIKASDCEYEPPAPPVAVIEKPAETKPDAPAFVTRTELESAIAGKVGREEFDRALRIAITK